MTRFYCLPHRCIVSPLVLPMAPRDAGFLSVPPSARDQLLSVFNNREGVPDSRLGGEKEDEKDERTLPEGKGGMVQLAR